MGSYELHGHDEEELAVIQDIHDKIIKSERKGSDPVDANRYPNPSLCFSDRDSGRKYAFSNTPEFFRERRYFFIFEVTKLLKPQSFVLFYPIPEDEDSLVVSLRLEMAYKKTDGDTYFYPVIRRKIGWAVDFDKNYEQPTFDNLIELIEYYTIYRYLNVATQQMEAFPYPDVAEASESDDTVFELSLDDVQHIQ